MSEQCILAVVVPMELRDDVVDALISCEQVSGFSLVDIAGYSREHAHFSLREQVEGFREFARFEVIHSAEWQASLLAALAPVCTPAGCRYTITPVLEGGHFS